jgi:hypothetical protein
MRTRTIRLHGIFLKLDWSLSTIDGWVSRHRNAARPNQNSQKSVSLGSFLPSGTVELTLIRTCRLQVTFGAEVSKDLDPGDRKNKAENEEKGEEA